MRSTRSCAAVALFVLMTASGSSRAAEPSPAEAAQLRETMHKVFDALAVVLPLSLDDEQLRERRRAREDRGRARHARRPGARRRDAHRPARRRLRRDLAVARARHRRRPPPLRAPPLPRGPVRDLAADLELRRLPLAAAQGAGLPARRRSSPTSPSCSSSSRSNACACSSRPASSTPRSRSARARFADPAIRPVDFDLDGELLTYLVVSVRVQGDLPRAHATLTKFAARSDVPLYLGLDLRALAASSSPSSGRRRSRPRRSRTRAS